MPDFSVSMPHESTRDVVFDLVDRDDVQIPLASLSMLLLTVYHKRSKALLRPTQPCLNSNGVTVVETVDSEGADVTRVTWTIRPCESVVVQANAPAGFNDEHTAYFELAVEPEDTVTLTNPFQTTLGSADVQVNWTAHGLAECDHVAFSGVNNVGGLDLDGIYIVQEVLSSDSVRITSRSTATASVTGGGSLTAFVRPRTNKIDGTLRVRNIDIT